MQFLSYLINGISLGSVYALIALGYTMVYGIAKMLNFAHGDVIMIGSYVIFFAFGSFGLNPIVSVLLSMVVCTILGVTILNLDEGYNFSQSLVNAVGSGLGFMLAMVLFSGVRSRVDASKSIPKAFQGIPVTLVAASIVSVSFMGFSGIVDGLFK